MQSKKIAPGYHDIHGFEWPMFIVADFRAAFANGFAPPSDAYLLAVPRLEGDLALGNVILDGRLLDIVEREHGPDVKYTLSGSFKSEQGVTSPCRYAYVGASLVAMIVPRTKPS